MASTIRQEDIDFCKETIKEHEPYPTEVFDEMTVFDGQSHEGDQRYAATICLRALLDIGFSEDEVNPWKNKH